MSELRNKSKLLSKKRAALVLFVVLMIGSMVFVKAQPITAHERTVTRDEVFSNFKSVDTARSTVEDKVIESDHPYANNYDHTWTITKDGATKIRVHFSYIEVEYSYDYLYVYDYQGTTLHKLTGTYSSGGWTDWSNGDTIKVRLITDYSVTKWGFKIDKIEYEGGSSSDSSTNTTWGNGGKYAIVIGISDYRSISDLNYADDDAKDWYNFLKDKGFEVHVYGDPHTDNYPRYDGLATEANVRAAIQGLAEHAKAGDIVVITSSGHGGADETNGWYYSGGGATNDVTSFLCMYDSASGTNGNYYDSEMASDLNRFASGVKITIVLDHCHSGGFGPDLMNSDNAQYILLLTTATGNGYGYDESDYQNGKFTYWLLQAFSNGQTTWEGAFNWILVKGRYLPVQNEADMPQMFDGNTTVNYSP